MKRLTSPTFGGRRGLVALSQMATFLAVEQKKNYGDMVTPCSVTCENVGIVVITRDEKTSKGTLYNVHEAGRLRQSFWVVSLDGADSARF